MKKKEHPFYCYKKMCRKTAYDTPEYLNQDDWDFLKKVIDVLHNGTGEHFHDLLWDFRNNPVGVTQNFFNRVVGWPEGYTYCMKESYTVKMGILCIRNQLEKLEKALKDHENKEPS